MVVDKKLAVLFSCLSSVLTTTVLLLQLYGVLLIKITQQQRRLNYLRKEAIMSKNVALARYLFSAIFLLSFFSQFNE